MRVRPPKDDARVFKILTGPVHHDPLYRPFEEDDAPVWVTGLHDPVLERRSTTRMPRNVAPMVCKVNND
jgi:hypothetical protein